MKKLVLSTCCAGLVALAGYAGVRTTRAAPEPTPVEWPMDARDKMAWAGIDARLTMLEQAMAPVVSDARTRREILQAAFWIQAQADELSSEVGKGHGVAVVRSGTSWVERK